MLMETPASRPLIFTEEFSDSILGILVLALHNTFYITNLKELCEHYVNENFPRVEISALNWYSSSNMIPIGNTW